MERIKIRPKSSTLKREEAQLISLPKRPASSQSSSTRTVMTLRELARVKQSILKDAKQASYADEKKKLLKELSNEKKSRFPDTLEAMRERKAEYVRRKKSEDEERRKLIDQQEAVYQKEHRNKILSDAESYFLKNTDRMKLLKSKQVLVETVHERKAQIDEKKARIEAEKMEAAKYHEFIMSKVKEGDEEEKAKIQKQKDLIDEMKVERKAQVDEVLARRAAYQTEQDAIGAAARARAQELVEEEKRKIQEREEAIAEQNKQFIIENEKDRELKASILKGELEQVERLEAEVAKIEKRKQDRKNVASRMFSEKQKQREQIIARATKMLAQKASQEEKLLGKQQEEHEAKIVAMEKAKEAKRLKDQEITMASWNDMINQKVKAYEDNQIESAQLLVASKEAAAAAAAEAAKEEADALAKVRKYKNQIKAEAQEEARSRVQNKIERIARERAALQLLGGDDEKFKTAAVKQIESNAKSGMLIKPLLPLLELDINPLMPAALRPEKRRQKGQPRD